MTPPVGPGSGEVAPPRRRIRKLDERTVQEIAAGEVIERPASVIKELVENAVDAGAREITVRSEGGGLALLEVSDDGFGIAPEELPLAFERHATSKLTNALDLPAVRTLGFRGEALASIAAVAKVELTTRVAGATEASRLRAEGGVLGTVEPAARATGTTVAVHDLFFNTPARRKFLRSDTSEMLRITEALEGLYLAHPEVALRFCTEGRRAVLYPAAASLREAAARVFGVQFLDGAFEFEGAVGPGLWARGVASHPSFSRGTARGIVLTVDGRVITSKAIADGVRFAYHELLPQGRFPVVVLQLTTEPGRVDVNVHPTKREVRFEKEGELREALRSLLHARLRDQPREAATRGPLFPGDRSGRSSETPAGTGGSEVPRRGIEGWDGSGTESAPTGAAPSRLEAALRGPVVGAMLLPLDGTSPATVVPGTAVHPTLTVLGQVGGLYIVGESRASPAALVLVDAHAASERVVYERLKGEAPVARQELLAPVEVELTPRQRGALETYQKELLRTGFVVEPFGRSAHRIRAVPLFRGQRARPEAVLRLLDELADGGRARPGDTLREKVARSAACHMAVRGGDVLTLPEMERLLLELYACPESFTCPHGRPIMLTLPRDRLDRWFLRP